MAILNPLVLKSPLEGVDVYDIGVSGECMACSSDVIAIGSHSGLTIYKSVDSLACAIIIEEPLKDTECNATRAKSLSLSSYDLGQEVIMVAVSGDYLVAGYEGTALSIIKISTFQVLTLGEQSGHSDYINSIDITTDGVIASTGDDRTLLIWCNGEPSLYPLGGAGKIVKFLGTDNDKVLILEAGNKVRVLDWKNKVWICTIFPGVVGCCLGSGGGPSIKDVTETENGDILVVGNGWWKSYDINSPASGPEYINPHREGNFPVLKTGGNSTFSVDRSGKITNASSSIVRVTDTSVPGLSNTLTHSLTQVVASARWGKRIAIVGSKNLVIIDNNV